jgi:hypothetical protein
VADVSLLAAQVRRVTRHAELPDLECRDAEGAERVTGMLATATENPSTSLEFIAALVSIALVGGSFFSATVTYFVRRRITTGRVSTSDAKVLWEQSQAMRDMLLKEKEMAESQRDKMMEINGQILPMLESINNSLIDISRIVKGKE